MWEGGIPYYGGTVLVIRTSSGVSSRRDKLLVEVYVEEEAEDAWPCFVSRHAQDVPPYRV